MGIVGGTYFIVCSYDMQSIGSQRNYRTGYYG